MARRPRMYIPGLPYHIVQRGNNREACFREPEDFARYLELWREISSRYEVHVHAYCLMTNHVHFLVTPDTSQGISRTTQVVGSRYAGFINKKYKRTGTLWEGRPHSSLVDSDRYLLAVYRYIELNPVRAGMVARPDEYRWSSFVENAWGRPGFLEGHDVYLSLGQTADQRRECYRELFLEELDGAALALIRAAAYHSQPVGDEHFVGAIEKRYGVKYRGVGQGRMQGPPDNDRLP